MGLKKLLVLVVVLGLLGAAVLVKTVRHKETAVSPSATDIQALLENGFSVEAVRGLEIRQNGDKPEYLRMEKNGSGGWRIASRYGTRARKESVGGFLDKLRVLRGGIRSEDEAVLADYSLTEEKAIRITVLGASDAKLADVLLSPQRPRGTQNFVRVNGSPRVIATDTDLLADLGLFSFSDQTTLQYRSFADLRVAPIEIAKVRAFEILPPSGKTLAFERTETEKEGVAWKLSGDASAIDTEKVNGFFSSVYNLYANESVDPASRSADLSPGKLWLKFDTGTAASPEKTEIFLGGTDPDKKLRYLKVMPDGVVYELPDASVAELLKKDKDHFVKPKSG